SSIAVRVIYRATHAALMLGMPSTGKKIVNESVYLFKFKEDKLIELRVVSDTLTIFMQLGQAIILRNEQEQIDEYIKILRNLGLLPKS
ncbi:MAG: ester cyclase, partial [Candidatus Kariarchaeaceae archaeon]